MAKKPTKKESQPDKKTSIKNTPVKKTTTKSTSSTTAKKTTQKPDFVIPPNIEKLLKPVKDKFYKDISVKEFKKIYKEEFDDLKEKYKNEKWNDMVFHKKAFTSIKNKKKRESLGGIVEPFISINFGGGKIRDLSEKRRLEVLDMWKKDPLKTVNDKLILTRDQKDPQTGEIKKIPILNSDNEVVPIDNREYFQRKDKSKWKNPNHGLAIPHAYRRTVCGVCINKEGNKGAFILELRDKQTEIDVPINIPTKVNARLVGTEILKPDKSNFISEELIASQIEYIDADIQSGIIDKEYANDKIQLLNELLDGDGEEIILFKLRSSKSTNFIELDEEEIETLDIPKKEDGTINIDLLYRKYFRNYLCDSAHLLKYHEKNRYINEDPDNVNWDEMVVMCDTNLLQTNMELSASGNYTMYIEDDSMLYYEVIQNENIIDSIKLLVPGHIKIDFGQDSKINIIGSPFQFPAQDENRNIIYEEDVDEEGNTIKVPLLDYPIIMVYGVYAIPEYKVEIEEIDLTEAEEIDVDKLLNPKEVEIEETIEPKKQKPKTTKSKPKKKEKESEEEPEKEPEEETDKKTEETKESEEEPDENLLEDEINEEQNPDDIW